MNATVLARRELGGGLGLLRVRPDAVPPAEAPWFDAGQWILVGVHGEEEGGGGPELERPLSVASEPEERSFLEFLVRWAGGAVPGDPFPAALRRLRPGDRVRLGDRFEGRFTLEASLGEDPRLKLLVAAGTGIAPFRSILRSLARRRGAKGLREMAVLHGARQPEELAIREELESLLGDAGAVYLPTVSRPPAGDVWRGTRGRVEELLDENRLAALEELLGLGPGGLTPERAVVLACGHRDTVREVVTRLLPRGFVPDDAATRAALDVPTGSPPSVFFELYDPGPLMAPGDAGRRGMIRRGR